MVSSSERISPTMMALYQGKQHIHSLSQLYQIPSSQAPSSNISGRWPPLHLKLFDIPRDTFLAAESEFKQALTSSQAIETPTSALWLALRKLPSGRLAQSVADPKARIRQCLLSA